MTLRKRWAPVLAIMWLTVGTAAYAEPIAFNFSGPVYRRFGVAPQQNGDIAVGSFVLDPNTLLVTEESPEHRRFEGSVDLLLSFRRPSGEAVVEYDLRDARLNLVINNDVTWDPQPYDAFRLGIAQAEAPFSFGVSLIDPTGTVFADTDLPTELDLLDFLGSRNRTYVGYYVDPAASTYAGQFDGYITSLNGVSAPEPVPEPGTLALLVGGGVFALLRRRRRLAQSSRSTDIPRTPH